MNGKKISANEIVHVNLHCKRKDGMNPVAEASPSKGPQARVRLPRAGPQVYVRMAVTAATSRNVGSTLKTAALRMKLMPRVPRSTTRLTAPNMEIRPGRR